MQNVGTITKRADKFMALRWLFALWKESCIFFAWENIKLFFLVSLNTFLRSLFLTVRDFWWLLLIIFAARQLGSVIIRDFLVVLMSFAYLLIVRPSIEKKGFHYYMRYLKKFPLYFFMALSVIALVFVPCKVAATILNLPFNYPGSLVHGPFSFVFIAGLFFLDRQTSLKNSFISLVSSWRFCLYFFPVMATIFVGEYVAVYYTIDVPFFYVAAQTQISVSLFATQIGLFVLRHLLILLLFSLLTAFYVRVKHRHHALFFMT